mgnify:CR=1 FL=1
MVVVGSPPGRPLVAAHFSGRRSANTPAPPPDTRLPDSHICTDRPAGKGSADCGTNRLLELRRSRASAPRSQGGETRPRERERGRRRALDQTTTPNGCRSCRIRRSLERLRVFAAPREPWRQSSNQAMTTMPRGPTPGKPLKKKWIHPRSSPTLFHVKHHVRVIHGEVLKATTKNCMRRRCSRASHHPLIHAIPNHNKKGGHKGRPYTFRQSRFSVPCSPVPLFYCSTVLLFLRRPHPPPHFAQTRTLAVHQNPHAINPRRHPYHRNHRRQQNSYR